jgi:spermidine synthase
VHRRRLFLALYFLSGSAGLLYQVAWSRLITLQMGHTVAAVSTVLAAFMGGLAAGAAAAGRRTPGLEPVTALRLYGWLELAIATAALLLAPALRALDPVLAAAYADGDGGAAFAVMRTVASLLLVAVPAALMGATFPAAVRWYAEASDGATRAGILYAVNTLGASAGAALTGFVLIPALGLSRTTAVGIATNVAIAACTFWLARSATLATRSAGTQAAARPTGAGARRAQARGAAPAIAHAHVRLSIAAGALAASGFVALILEVTWTRGLALVLGPTTQAFGMMLAIVILGLGTGSLAAARVARGMKRPLSALALTLLGTAAGAALVMVMLDDAPLVIAELAADAAVPYRRVLAAQAQLAASLVLPATLALGAAFPFGLAAVRATAGSTSRDAAMLYAANAGGAIVGSLAAGFALIPLLGLQRTLALAATVAAAAGLLVLHTARPGRRRLAAAGAVAAAMVLSVWLLPDWNRAMLSSGAYKYARQTHGGDLQSSLEAGELLFYEEGAAGTVTVRRSGGATSLAIDGKVDASDAGDMLTQKALAHLPLLLHPQPRHVAIIGLGSGVTLGAALRHPVSQVETLEISPEVVKASGWFGHINGAPLSDRRSRLIVGDGRAHLRYAARQYDVIISEPSNPWMAGLATLFTRDFFQAARARLAPGGLFCQWAHTYDISEADLRSVIATFASVFPDGTLWQVGEADILLIGGTDSIEPSLTVFQRGWHRPGVAADLAQAGVRDPFGLLSLFAGTGEALAAYAEGGRIQTDDHMPLEFSAPRHALTGSGDRARLRQFIAARPRPEAVTKAFATATATDWRNRGVMFLGAHAYQDAYEAFTLALERAPADTEALEGLTRAAVPLRREHDAADRLRRIAASDPANVPARLALSGLFASMGRFEEALEAVAGIPLEGASGRVLEHRASILADAGDADRLASTVGALERAAPEAGITLFYRATERYLRGRPDEAAAIAARAAALLPEARVWNLLGAAQATRGDRDAARRAFTSAIATDPRDPGAYVNLAQLELETGNARRAAGLFSEALALDPSSAPARQGLALALTGLGQHERAAAVMRLRR